MPGAVVQPQGEVEVGVVGVPGVHVEEEGARGVARGADPDGRERRGGRSDRQIRIVGLEERAERRGPVLGAVVAQDEVERDAHGARDDLGVEGGDRVEHQIGQGLTDVEIVDLPAPRGAAPVDQRDVGGLGAGELRQVDPVRGLPGRAGLRKVRGHEDVVADSLAFGGIARIGRAQRDVDRVELRAGAARLLALEPAQRHVRLGRQIEGRRDQPVEALHGAVPLGRGALPEAGDALAVTDRAAPAADVPQIVPPAVGLVRELLGHRGPAAFQVLEAVARPPLEVGVQRDARGHDLGVELVDGGGGGVLGGRRLVRAWARVAGDHVELHPGRHHVVPGDGADVDRVVLVRQGHLDRQEGAHPLDPVVQGHQRDAVVVRGLGQDLDGEARCLRVLGTLHRELGVRAIRRSLARLRLGGGRVVVVDRRTPGEAEDREQERAHEARRERRS